MYEENTAWGESGDEMDLEYDQDSTAYWEMQETDIPVAAVIVHATAHRITTAGSQAHHRALAATKAQVSVTLGNAAPGNTAQADLASDLVELLFATYEAALRVTLVCGLAHDPGRVEIVNGVAIDLEWSDSLQAEVIRFEDGDYVDPERLLSICASSLPD